MRLITNSCNRFSILLILFALAVLPAFAQSSSSTEKGDIASLAIDRKDGDLYGWAINYKSQSEADERARQECAKNGGDCHVVLRFQGGCGAYVVERGNSSLYGWGTADTRATAESRALEEARARGGKDLVVRVWGCNDGSLINVEEVPATEKGVYSFHMVFSSEENKLFITPVLYHPNVARRSGDQWVWTDDAEEKMTPSGRKFIEAVKEDLYGYLGDLKDEAVKTGEIDWKGKNELEFNNEILNEPNADRKAGMEAAVEGVHQMAKDENAEIVVIEVQ